MACHALHLLIRYNLDSISSSFLDRWSLPPGRTAGKLRQFSQSTFTRRIHTFQIVTRNHIIDALRIPQRTIITSDPAHRAHVDIRLLVPTQIPEDRTAWPSTRSKQGTVGSVDRLPCDSGKGCTILLLRRPTTGYLHKTQFWNQRMQDLNGRTDHLWRCVIPRDDAD